MEWGHNAWSQWNCRHCHPATTHDPLVPGTGSQPKSEHQDNNGRNHELDKNVSKRTLTTLEHQPHIQEHVNEKPFMMSKKIVYKILPFTKRLT
jgi:hypothetical protein